jgi:exopolysaccharide biosynthesis polyprenyl glycosylphosphotransferase
MEGRRAQGNRTRPPREGIRIVLTERPIQPDLRLLAQQAAGPRRAPGRARRRAFGRRALAIDLTMLVLAAVCVEIASPTSSPTGGVPNEPIGWLLVFCLLVPVLFKIRGMYEPPLRLDFVETLRLVVTGTALAAIVAMAARVVLENHPYVAAETLRHWLLALVFLTLGRALVLAREAHGRTTMDRAGRTLIVGAGKVGYTAAKRLLDDPTLGLRPVAFLDGNPLETNDPSLELPIYDWEAFEQVVETERIEHAIIAFSTADHDTLLAITRRCWECGVAVSVVPRLFEIKGTRLSVDHLGGLPLFQLDPPDPKGWQFGVKYALDRVVAGSLLMLLAPVLLVAMLAVRLSLGSPIFYRQLRVGRDGRVFNMLKLRTLREFGTQGVESDADWAAAELGERIARHEPLEWRMTRVGSLLRRTAIDELPQLWNVLRGDMSLVGPRPERAHYAARFEEQLYRYADRHRVKSGLTGWAQINGLRGKTSLRDRVEWDNHYIENWSPWLDVKILMKTIPYLVMRADRKDAGTSVELAAETRQRIAG